MTAKTFIAAVATVAFTIAATVATVSNAQAQTTNTSAAATSAAATSAAQTATATAAVSATQTGSGLTREQVKAQFLEARKNGQLLQTEADFDVAQTRKQVAK